MSLWSICLTVSPSVDVQLGGGLPGPAPYIAFAAATPDPSIDPCAMPHKLLSPSLDADSAPENRYETPGWGDSSPSGPIMLWPALEKGEGPRILEILLYSSERTSRSESSVWW